MVREEASMDESRRWDKGGEQVSWAQAGGPVWRHGSFLYCDNLRNITLKFFANPSKGVCEQDLRLKSKS
jgi:hypothetical protein